MCKKKENAYCRDALKRRNREAKELRAERTPKPCLRRNRLLFLDTSVVYDVTSGFIVFVSISLIRAQHKHNHVGKYLFFLYHCLPFYYTLSMFQLQTEMYISTLEEKHPLFAVLCLKIPTPDTDLYL